ncbi:MAG: replication-associated recombination protein A [Nitrospinota bacterium]
MGKEWSRPLAERMRPKSFKNFVGQEHLLGPGKVIRNLAERGNVGSIIFWGPPGTGKTTLAELLAMETGRHFVTMSAVNDGVKELRKAVDRAMGELERNSRGTILFIDEIHRFNKGQQDAILPWVEKGVVSFLSATTENPAFQINSALRSRCRVFKLRPLSFENIQRVLERALREPVQGFGNLKREIEKEAMELLVLKSNGDCRFALNALEAAVLSFPEDKTGKGLVTLKLVEEILQSSLPLYDKSGSAHFDHASAFQKSMRGSDPDAALYWLGKMIVAGEDPEFIARRMIITASEDVGNADPVALLLAVSSAEAAVKTGWPEARIPLAQAASYIACAPKSNAVIKGIDSVIHDISEKGESFGVPEHLKPSNSYKSGRHEEKKYKYPPSFPGSFVLQDYLPNELRHRRYYKPEGEGREAKIKERIRKLWPQKE